MVVGKYIPSVTAAMTLASLPVVVAVLGRPVRGRAVLGLDRDTEKGRLGGYGALSALEKPGPDAFAVLGGIVPVMMITRMCISQTEDDFHGLLSRSKIPI